MQLTEIRDPCKRNVNLISQNNPFTTNEGWNLEGFRGDDGEEYERAQRGSIVRWFKLQEEARCEQPKSRGTAR